MRSLGIMLLLTILLQGCGRKGPLYLPPPPAPSAAPQPAPAAAPAEKPESRK